MSGEHASTDEPRLRLVTLALLAIGIAAMLFQTIDYINFSVDDVFISFRYAENVARGIGWVYNAGEFVEGYSNWLWVALLSIAARLGMNQDHGLLSLLWTAKASGAVVMMINVVLVHRLWRRMNPDSENALIRFAPSLLMMTSGAFVLWGVSGMETHLCTFFFLLAAAQAVVIMKWDDAVRAIPPWRFVAFGLSFLGAMLTRPEPVMHAVIAFIFVFATIEKRDRISFILYAILPCIVGYGVFLAWRATVYHDLVPNTFYAKSSISLGGVLLGIKYSLGSLWHFAGPLLMCLFIPLVRRPMNRVATYFLLMILATVFFVMISAGDWMPAWRFFVPVAGFIALLASCGLKEALDALRRIGVVRPVSPFVTVLIVLVTVGARIASDRVSIRALLPDTESGFRSIRGVALSSHESIAAWLAQHEHGAFSIATGEAGWIGYRNRSMSLIDCNGLMDKRIAQSRQRGDAFPAASVLDRMPKYIILPDPNEPALLLGGPNDGAHYAAAFLSSPRFAREYTKVFSHRTYIVYRRTE